MSLLFISRFRAQYRSVPTGFHTQCLLVGQKAFFFSWTEVLPGQEIDIKGVVTGQTSILCKFSVFVWIVGQSKELCSWERFVLTKYNGQCSYGTISFQEHMV